jgi:glycosyltransferase involved in cell wall biosynthesis
LTAPSSARTVLVHDWLTGMRGGEKVLEQIGREFPAAPIFTLLHIAGSVSSELEAHDIHTSFLQRMPWAKARYRYYLPLFPRAIESLKLPPCDLVLSSSHAVAKGVRKPPGAMHVCYCHTPMRYVWDQQQAYFPDSHGSLAALRRKMLERLRRWDVATAHRVDHYLANSNFVVQRIERYYQRPARVLHPPVDTDFFTPDPSIAREAFCLYVSALAPYKRIDLAVAACQRLGLELRVVGSGPERARLERVAAGGTSPVHFLGRIRAETLRDLYRRALCFVQPGIEDFGISAVEALSCGCPVAAFDGGGVQDIVDSGVHGLLYGEETPEALAATIDKLRNMRFNLLDLRQRAETFSTMRFRRQLNQYLAETYTR